ncbi:Fc.00g023500.m01.CDS01 [Cosmosporella sp. VM-42]
MQEVRRRQHPIERVREAQFQAHIRESIEQLAGDVPWVADALWPDDWASRFSPKKPISPTIENKPYLSLKGPLNGFGSDIRFFIAQDSTLRRANRRAVTIEGFCIGAEPFLDSFIHLQTKLDVESLTRDEQQPKAWVSDRNLIPQDPNHPHQYEAMLSSPRFYELLRLARFSETVDPQNDVVVAPPRRIYIADPEGPSILSLIRTVPFSQARALRELFGHYVTSTPVPLIRVLEYPDWSTGVFSLHFNLPFYALSTTGKQDTRTIFKGKKPFRKMIDLGFLIPSQTGKEEIDGEDAISNGPAFLHEAACSLIVTGPHAQCWTAVCLNDEFFMEASKFEPVKVNGPTDEVPESADDMEATESTRSEDLMALASDPITDVAGEDSTASPRTYFLQGLAAALIGILQYQQDIHDWFQESIQKHKDAPSNIVIGWRKRFQEVLKCVLERQSLSIDQLEKFLHQVALVGPSGVPKGHSMQSLASDNLAIKSLKSIIESLDELREVEQTLQRFMKSCEEARRERKDEHAEELKLLADYQKDLGRKLETLTFFGVAIGMLSLAAQLYSCLPENNSPNPAFWILPIITIFVGTIMVGILMYGRWSWVFAKAWERLRRNDTERNE